MTYQTDYPNLVPSINIIGPGSIKLGDIITNIYSKAAWPASDFDVKSIDGCTHKEHWKFRKMIPII